MSYRQAYTELENKATTVVGETTSGNTAAFGNSEIGNAEIGDNAASGAKVSSEYGPIFAGSPAVPGNQILFGTGNVDGGSDAWIVFPMSTPFAAAPTVVATPTDAVDTTVFIEPGSVNAGSFYIQATAANATFNYMAGGSGRGA